MQNETPPPFAPFLPETPSPPVQPDSADTGNKPPKPPRKAKKKRQQSENEKALRDEGRMAREVYGESTETKKRRKTRKVAEQKRAAKYDLQTILRIASTLKESDQKVFEKLLGEVSALAKGSRTRVLKALGEVFG